MTLRWLLWGVVAMVFTYLACFLWAAWPGWFVFDDFVFMARVRESEPWSWLDPMSAAKDPFFFFFRPLGMESFYYVGLGLFGLNVLGFRLLALLTHALTSALSYRVGRQLGLGSESAVLAASLFFTAAPPTHVLFEGYSYQYTSALFFSAISVTLFLDHLQRGRLLPLLGSAVAMACGMLCNEVAAASVAACGLLALRHEGGVGPSSLWRVARRLLPHLALLAPLLALRVVVFRQFPMFWPYQMVFGSNLAETFFRYLSYAVGPGPMLRGREPFSLLPLAATVGVVGAALALALRSQAGRRRARDWLLPLWGVLLGWGAVSLLPFLAIVAAHARYAAPLSLPLALALGAVVDVSYRTASPTARRYLAGAMLALLFASLPLGTFRERHDNREGPRTRRLYELVGEVLARDSQRVRFFVLHGGSELAAPAIAKEWLWMTYGGTFMRASFPERHRAGGVTLHWVDVEGSLPRARMADSCSLLAIDREGDIQRVERSLAERLLPAEVAEFCGFGPG
jgi:hypothetical protein